MPAALFAPSVRLPRVRPWALIVSQAVIVASLVGQPVHAQVCYEFSNAQGDQPATVRATFPITAVPASFVPPGQGHIEFTAAFSSYSGLDGTRVSYSPLHIATMTVGTTSATFNTFVVTITREGSIRRLQFDATQYPVTDPARTFSVFIQQSAPATSSPLPEGLAGKPLPLSAWGEHPSSSMDSGHVKLASVSFVGPCTHRGAAP